YVGEVYDARKEPVGWLTPGFDDSSWKQAEKADSPQGKIKAGMEPPIKVTNSLSPEQITRIKQDHYVIDFGEMTAGRLKINIRGEEGREIKIKYGEKLTEEGTINLKQDLIEDDIQIDTYICRGNGREIWKPKFSYKGFRFVELINFPENPDKNNIKAEIIHNDVNSTSKFQTSKELFNQIHENCRRAILNNFHSVPTDTPVFEKNGWTGDGQLTAEAAIYNFDMIRFYYKWLEDFKDAQRENGEIPPIVPTSDWGYSDTPWGWGEVKHSVPAWDSAYILIAWWLYQYYGDEQILEKHYSGMKKYVDYLGTRAEGNIVKEGLGDWLAPGGEWEEPYLTSTAYYYLDTKIVARIAEILELEGDKEKYNGLKEEIKDDFNQEFYNKNKNIYEVEGTEEYRQTSNIIPFAFGLVPEKYDKKSILNNLIDDIENKQEGHLNTGIIGTKYILTVLTENGYKDLAYKIAARTTYPSWGYWIKQGATSLYEKWEDDSRSLNHHMYGTIEDWYYKSLAGIKPLKPGYKSIKIKPYLPEKLDEVRAEVETVKGKVISSWKKDKNNIKYEFEVPVNTTAEVLLPLNNIDYSKIKIENREIVEKVDMNEDRVKLIINSGEYLIENVGGGNKFIIVKKE
ncbi:MAG: family 78 glycoside hydrolase catalytic domain, partial [Bacillota bacterium]